MVVIIPAGRWYAPANQMIYRHLAPSDLPEIHATFLAAFSDYAVQQQPTLESLASMLRRRGMAWEHSVGVEGRGRFEAVMAVGFDRWQDRATAYDIFTGVRPEARGRGLAGGMFRFTLPGLRARGAQRFLLEVIDSNAAAIKAYRRVGFDVSRDFQCLRLPARELQAAAPDGVEIHRVDDPPWEALRELWSWAPSWQNDHASLVRLPESRRTALASRDGRILGYGVLYTDTGDLAQLAVAPDARRGGLGRAILGALARELRGADAFRVLNIDAAASGDLAFWRQVGAEPTVRQHEMQLRLQ